MSQEKADLERLSQRLLEISDNERERIARILHEDLGQQVASLSILTSTLKRRLSAEDKECCDQADKIREKLIALAGSMRRLSHDLHPALLQHAGPAIALRQFCEELASQTGRRIAYESSGDFQDVPLAIGVCVYRIAEQALRTSSEKTDNETIVKLTRNPASLVLTIVGNVAADLTNFENGLVFECCRQRLHQFSGHLLVEHSSFDRWQLTASVPWRSAAAQA